jgi:1-deoxy-D-xylulose-5-phosphate synthase
MPCDILKLTKIFPLELEAVCKAMRYKRIIFFEEAVGYGSISEKFGNLLMEAGYKGDYRRIAAKGFVKQATVKSALDKLGMSSGKMVEYIKNGGGSYGTA